MPVYEYRCTKGHTFEVIQSMSDDPLTKCEVCGSPVERVLHSPSIHFKGSGFYNTDYGTKKRQREQKSSNAESGSSSSTSESSSSSSESSSGSSEKKTDTKSPAEKTKPASSSD
jgi:putative FmdB family regulatory protein